MSPYRLCTAFAASFLLAATGAAAADAPGVDIPALIDKLTEVADSDIGYSPVGWGSPFLPLDHKDAWEGGLLFQKPGVPSDTLRAIVKQGAAAVPFLIAHLDDKQATKLTITNDLNGTFELVDYLDFNALTAKEDPNPKRPAAKESVFGSPVPGRRHVVTVGDLCFVALGQIANRRFSASVYIPSGNVIITSPTESPALCQAVRKEWAGLTPQRHRASLIDDFLKPDSDERRIGACKRLAYYYPDALEPLALRVLSQPPYNHDDMHRFVRDRLYTAAPKEVHSLFDDFVAKHGEAARDGILIQLFSDLAELEKAEQARPPATPKDFGDQPRRLLVELYGKPENVKGADLKNQLPLERLLAALDPCDKGGLIKEGLIYDNNARIDAAVRELMSATDDAYIALGCMARLVGRGYDEDIAKCCRRLCPGENDPDHKYFQEYLDKAGWTRLHTAVERGDVEEVRRRIAEKVDVNAAAKDGRTPLHLAAAAGDCEIVQALIDDKADLNPKDSTGRTPVELAARQGEDDVVLILAAHGCELPDILSAAIAGNAEAVEKLLKNDPKQAAATNIDGATLLHLAARHGHAITAAALLTAGADVNARDKDGWTPLHLAADRGHEDVVGMLLDHKADPNAVNDEADKLSPLHAAVLAAKRRSVELLIDKGADPNLGRDCPNGTPLHLAAAKDLPDMAALLLDRGAKLDLKNKDGWKPLHLAAQVGCEGVARILLDHKADLNAAGRDERRPLHEAATAGHRKVVELLLDRKADIEAQDGEGRTPLHAAAAAGRAETVALLLDKGANANAKTRDGDTPLYTALASADGGDAARVLFERKLGLRPAVTTTPIELLHLAILARDRKAVHMLLERSEAADTKDGDGQTPLHWAACEEDAGVVQELLNYGADVDTQAKDGSTPLHLAVANGNLAVVIRLLDLEADATIKNAKGETPLDCLPTKGAASKQATEIKRLLEPHTPKK